MKIPLHFILKRLHSFTGFLPIAAFLTEHMFSNFYILQGPEAYNARIELLSNLPFVMFMEIGLIALPILYHAGYGFYIVFTGKDNLAWYPYRQNWFDTLQRWTGLLAFAYILFHLYQTKGSEFLYGKEVNYARMAEIMLVPGFLWFYLASFTAIMFHFANGLWGALIGWGAVTSDAGRRVSGWICALAGVTLYVMGVSALLTLAK